MISRLVFVKVGTWGMSSSTVLDDILFMCLAEITANPFLIW